MQVMRLLDVTLIEHFSNNVTLFFTSIFQRESRPRNAQDWYVVFSHGDI